GTLGARWTILAASLMHQLDEPTGGKAIFEEQKQLVECMCQCRIFNTQSFGFGSNYSAAAIAIPLF
ncbi:MAG: hypothetical protein ACK5OC_21590, partial [Pirellula sp.]